MCVAALPALGLGSTAPLFYAGLGLGAVNQIVGANRANQQAAFMGRQAAQAAESANLALAREQEGLGARLKEERKANIQEQLALAKRGAQAAGAVRASERSGLTIDLLLGDVERQEGEAKSLLEQTMESATQQYRRNTLGLTAKRDDRRNRALETYNKAKGMRRGPLDVALGTLSSGLSSYTNLLG
tara:strand:+ start:338 stop:895 length:558 start_codon:yes stop_codon:yes gene_type:complete